MRRRLNQQLSRFIGNEVISPKQVPAEVVGQITAAAANACGVGVWRGLVPRPVSWMPWVVVFRSRTGFDWLSLG